MTKKQEQNYFEILNSIDVSDKVEKKDKLKYLSWAWAWAEIKKRHPNLSFVIKKNEQGLPFFYDDNLGYIVETEVTIDNISHSMWLPVMDNKNKSMKNKPYTYKITKSEWDKESRSYVDVVKAEKRVEAATMFDINSAIMRCLTKNIALHGLGLYIYAGEDVPRLDTKEETIEDKFTKQPTGAMANLADTANEEIKLKAEEERLNKLKKSLSNMGSISEIDGYLEERGRLEALQKMSQVNAAQAMLIIKNAKLAIDPEYKEE